ncbi:hypothetical protein AAES_151178 [Amazona aestiva]|uniref:Uncharacterized protein n=1 Tax=Amazona aestiva TaxID=12930 RepID=A0A0Q3QVC0_AMAAE|nr:hypothetical protein AAES_151178 [Amazona aestiva]
MGPSVGDMRRHAWGGPGAGGDGRSIQFIVSQDFNFLLLNSKLYCDSNLSSNIRGFKHVQCNRIAEGKKQWGHPDPFENLLLCSGIPRTYQDWESEQPGVVATTSVRNVEAEMTRYLLVMSQLRKDFLENRKEKNLLNWERRLGTPDEVRIKDKGATAWFEEWKGDQMYDWMPQSTVTCLKVDLDAPEFVTKIN